MNSKLEEVKKMDNPKRELVCEGCGQYESECKCELNDRYPLPKPDNSVPISESRLLEREIIMALIKDSFIDAVPYGVYDLVVGVAKAQKAKTASLVSKEIGQWLIDHPPNIPENMELLQYTIMPKLLKGEGI